MAQNRINTLTYTDTLDATRGTLSRANTSCPGTIGLYDVIEGEKCVRDKERAYSQWSLERARRWEGRRRHYQIEYHVEKRKNSKTYIWGPLNQIRQKRNKVIYHVLINKFTKKDSLVLHATAVGPMKLDRYYDLSVHFVIDLDGRILQLHDEGVKCYGSSALNSRSVAVEFVGNYARKIDSKTGKKVWWGNKRKDTLSQQQITSGRNLVMYLKEKIGIKYVFAHKQARDKNCPGPEIWFNIGEWAIANNYSSDAAREVVYPDGKKIPKDWRNKKWDIDNRLLSPEFN